MAENIENKDGNFKVLKDQIGSELKKAEKKLEERGLVRDIHEIVDRTNDLTFLQGMFTAMRAIESLEVLGRYEVDLPSGDSIILEKKGRKRLKKMQQDKRESLRDIIVGKFMPEFL